MKHINTIKKYGPGIAGFTLLTAAGSALADADDLVTAATTALTGAETAAWSVGGLVVAAIAVLVTIGIVVGLLRKA